MNDNDPFGVSFGTSIGVIANASIVGIGVTINWAVWSLEIASVLVIGSISPISNRPTSVTIDVALPVASSIRLLQYSNGGNGALLFCDGDTFMPEWFAITTDDSSAVCDVGEDDVAKSGTSLADVGCLSAVSIGVGSIVGDISAKGVTVVVVGVLGGTDAIDEIAACSLSVADGFRIERIAKSAGIVATDALLL